jgi:hypothetical protein
MTVMNTRRKPSVGTARLGMVEAVVPAAILVLNGNMATTNPPCVQSSDLPTSLQKLPT